MERLYYLSHWLYLHRIPVLPRLCMLLIRFVYGSFVPYQVQIGPGVDFGHRQGIVIARSARIGQRCTIRHQVTIANGAGGAATIGDDVKIGAGAKIIGTVSIGDRARIGANAVVVKDVAADTTVVGIPAQPVFRRRDAEQARAAGRAGPADDVYEDVD
jgi:serine O-acetyltransferase